MTNEASKTNLIRGPQFIEKYFSGRVIDIGCGVDRVTDLAEPFDLEHGDAGNILEYRTVDSYDAVHSSHCLEHMTNVPEALKQWWALVKPGGYLILVVPDEDLYEQGRFPSVFNTDHKATFRIDKRDSWSSASYDLRSLLEALENIEIISIERQDTGYDYKIQSKRVSGFGEALLKLNAARRRISRSLHLNNQLIDKFWNRLFFTLGAPIDQTLGQAVAQIQAIARKRPESV